MSDNCGKNGVRRGIFRNLLLQTGSAGFLTAILLIAGLDFVCSGLAHAGATVTWNGTFDGTFTINGQESYPSKDARFISSSEGFKKVLTSSFSNSVYIDDVASGNYRSLGEKTWLPGARWPYGQDTFRYGSDTDPVRFYGSDRIYNCGTGIKCIYLRIVPNSEVLESIRKAGQVKKLVVNYVINDRLGASATLTATFNFIPDPPLKFNWVAGVDWEPEHFRANINYSGDDSVLSDVDGTITSGFVIPASPERVNKQRFETYESTLHQIPEFALN